MYKLFHILKIELEIHTNKEETFQYPAIEQYVKTKNEANLNKAIQMIEELNNEHVGAGNLLKQLRIATKNYTVQNDGCTTYNTTYTKLKELDSDTFEHVHLENNILFPRLIALKKE